MWNPWSTRLERLVTLLRAHLSPALPPAVNVRRKLWSSYPPMPDSREAQQASLVLIREDTGLRIEVRIAKETVSQFASELGTSPSALIEREPGGSIHVRLSQSAANHGHVPRAESLQRLFPNPTKALRWFCSHETRTKLNQTYDDAIHLARSLQREKRSDLFIRCVVWWHCWKVLISSTWNVILRTAQTTMLSIPVLGKLIGSANTRIDDPDL